MSVPTDPIQALAQTDDLAFVGEAMRYLDGLMDADEVAAFSASLREDAARREILVAVAYLQQHISRLEQTADERSLPLSTAAHAIGDDPEPGDTDGLLDALLAEHGEGDGALKLVELNEPPHAVSVTRATPAPDGGPTTARPDERGAIIDFAGLYIARKDTASGGGIKVKHLGWAAALMAAAFVGWNWFNRPTPPVELPVVATVTGQNGAAWDRPDVIRVGTALRQDDAFTLEHGLLEIRTQRGATVLAEGPCEVQLVGDNRVRLTRGKLVARVPDARAHGFAVDTPGAQLIDLGTEFGVAVDGRSATRTAVFDGKVVLAGAAQPKAGGTSSGQTRPLELTPGRTAQASSSGRITEDAVPSAKLANSFRWSIDEPAMPDYVLAYWRFDDVPVGQRLAHQDGRDADRGRIAARDSSGRNNHLYTYDEDFAPWGVDDIPGPVVPGPRLFNTASIRTYGQTAGGFKNLYTRGGIHDTSALELAEMDRWTVELSVKPKRLTGTQSLLAKQYLSEHDGTVDWLPNHGCVLAIQLIDGFIGVEMLDDDGRLHTYTGKRRLSTDRWHHVAVVRGDDTLDVYVRPEGQPLFIHERLAASLPAASLRLLDASNAPPFGRRLPLEWNLGGLADTTQHAPAMLDEVRICRTALPVDRLLFTPRSSDPLAAAVMPSDGWGSD